MGAFLTAGYMFQTLGLEETRPPTQASSPGLFVVFTPLLGAVILRERVPGPRGRRRASSALACTCCRAPAASLEFRGDGLVLLCALAFAAHILATARASRQHDVGALLAVQLGVRPLACLVIAAARRRSREAPGLDAVWSALIVTSLVASALGFFVQTYAQQHAPPAHRR